MDISRLPPHLAVLYGSKEPPKRGPRPALSLDAVVKVGIEIADADGLGGVSMAKVAERLGFTTMSLYRYVKSKDDLLVLMADAANSEQPPPDTTGEWRAAMTAWATGVFATYRRHPWLLRVTLNGPPAGPSQLVWMEAGLRGLAGVDAHIGVKLQVIQLLHGYARGEAQLNADVTGADQPVPYGEVLRTVVDPAALPMLGELVSSGVMDGPTDYDEEIDFTFGLATILDGVERLFADPRH